MNMSLLKNAGFVLATLVVVGLIQKNVMQLPVVGEFLPGGKTAA